MQHDDVELLLGPRVSEPPRPDSVLLTSSERDDAQVDDEVEYGGQVADESSDSFDLAARAMRLYVSSAIRPFCASA